MGRYNSHGLAWRYELPPEMIGIFTINLIKFLASAITIHLTINSCDGPHKVLTFTDNSSALGWLYKASFSKKMTEHNTVARWLASILMKMDAALYSQFIKGYDTHQKSSLSSWWTQD